jgi:hypothetical protein
MTEGDRLDRLEARVARLEELLAGQRGSGAAGQEASRAPSPQSTTRAAPPPTHPQAGTRPAAPASTSPPPTPRKRVPAPLLRCHPSSGSGNGSC